MPTELLIRPGHNDHLAIADLIAPGGAGRLPGAPPPISRIVLDAPLAKVQTKFAEDARAAGLPLLVDPMTFLFQGETAPDNTWSRLSFADASAWKPEDLRASARRHRLVTEVIDFQLEHQATVVIPPYFYAASPSDPWFEVSLACLADAATYLATISTRLPLMPVLTGRLDRFARPAHYAAGIDRFAAAASAVGAQTVAAQLGPAGKPTDTYAKVLSLFLAIQRLRRPGLGVHAWRQGVYGPALAAAGIQGYETGIGFGEGTDLAGAINRRRPKPPAPEDEKKGGGGASLVYLPVLGRSVVRKVVDALNTNLATRALIVCDDATMCCPNGMESTLAHRRQHAVRSRARYLSELDQMPQPTWRLYKIAQNARKAAQVSDLASKILTDAGLEPLRSTSQLSLAAVANYLRGDRSAVA